MKSVEHLISEQSKQLDHVKQTIADDILRIREAVQSMISEALLKREAKKKKAADSDGLAGSGVEGGSALKAKSESEKMERLLKTMEEDYKRELVELQKKTQEQEREIEARQQKEAELQRKVEEEKRVAGE